jgi:hypothetical protein
MGPREKALIDGFEGSVPEWASDEIKIARLADALERALVEWRACAGFNDLRSGVYDQLRAVLVEADRA